MVEATWDDYCPKVELTSSFAHTNGKQTRAACGRTERAQLESPLSLPFSQLQTIRNPNVLDHWKRLLAVIRKFNTLRAKQRRLGLAPMTPLKQVAIIWKHCFNWIGSSILWRANKAFSFFCFFCFLHFYRPFAFYFFKLSHRFVVNQIKLKDRMFI